jgi:hypothetical protein
MIRIAEFIKQAYPEGFDQETAILLYSVLGEGDVIMEGEVRVHRSLRGLAADITEARGCGNKGDIYPSPLLDLYDPKLNPVRGRILSVPGIVRIENFPREQTPEGSIGTQCSYDSNRHRV